MIVRLIGIYLLATCAQGLLQLGKMQAMGGQLGMSQNSVLGDIKVYLWIGLLVGIGSTIFAGPLARILTFDSEPKGQARDFDDRFLGKR